jgi:hypothetical protein
MKKALPDCSTSMEGLDTVQIAHEPLALPIHGAFLLFIYRARDRLFDSHASNDSDADNRLRDRACRYCAPSSL